MNNRIEWIDYAKGIGILLVVFGHVLTDATTHGVKLTDNLYTILVIIYGFHMPLFFLLAGMFAPGWVIKKYPIVSKARSLICPYIIWSLLLGSIAIFFPSMINNKLTWLILLQKILFDPYLYLWFIYYLFICFVIYYFFSKLPISNIYIYYLSIIGITIATIIPLPWQIEKFITHFQFFACGILINIYKDKLAFIIKHSTFLIIPFIIFEAYYINNITIYQPYSIFFTSFYNIFFAYCGIAITIFISRIMDKHNILSHCKTFGKLSMIIYLNHLTINGGYRILTNKYINLNGTIELYLFVISSLIIGVYVSIFIGNIIKFYKIDKFIFGK